MISLASGSRCARANSHDALPSGSLSNAEPSRMRFRVSFRLGRTPAPPLWLGLVFLDRRLTGRRLNRSSASASVGGRWASILLLHPAPCLGASAGNHPRCWGGKRALGTVRQRERGPRAWSSLPSPSSAHETHRFRRGSIDRSRSYRNAWPCESRRKRSSVRRRVFSLSHTPHHEALHPKRCTKKRARGCVRRIACFCVIAR